MHFSIWYIYIYIYHIISYNSYGRRWVWLLSDDVERPETRGSGEEKLTEEEEKALDDLNKEYEFTQKGTTEEIFEAYSV